MGIKVEKSKPYGSIKSKKLVDFEKQLGHKLPKDYRAFLTRHNGGMPTPCDFDFDGNMSSLHNMFGLHDGPDYCRLDLGWDTFRGRIPDALFPIADDHCGNLICIGIKGKYADRIFFWDHELETDSGKPGFKNVTKIANSFQQFVDSLFEWVDPDESDIEKAVKRNDVKFVRALIDSGYNIETKDEYKRTLIENAAIHNSTDVIKLLIANGARRLKQALALAEQNAEYFPEHKQSIKLLKKPLPRKSK